jgi:hypothetical protein
MAGRAMRGLLSATAATAAPLVLGGAGASPGGAGRPCSKKDVPDPAFQDTNCDGIDGDVAHGVFVSPSGSDAFRGTMQRPKRTIAAGVRAAAILHCDVYVAAGTYDEGAGVQLASGVSIHGAYGRGWKRSTAFHTVLLGKP